MRKQLQRDIYPEGEALLRRVCTTLQEYMAEAERLVDAKTNGSCGVAETDARELAHALRARSALVDAFVQVDEPALDPDDAKYDLSPRTPQC